MASEFVYNFTVKPSRIVNNNNNNNIQTTNGHQQQPYTTFKNNLILVSGGYDNTIRLWNVERGFCEKCIQNADNSHVNALCIKPSRDILASAGFQHIRLYDIETNGTNPLVNFEGISKNVSSVGFSFNNSFMYTGGEDYYARIWDARGRRLAPQRQCRLKTPINSLFLHPNEIEIYIADQSGSIWIWNLQNDYLQRLFVTNDGFIQHIAYDKECRLLAALDTLGKCYIFLNTSYCPQEMIEEKNGEMTASGYLHRRIIFQAHDKYGLKCCFSPDSTLLATTSADTTVKFWRTSDLSIVNSTNTIQIDDPSDIKVRKRIKQPVTAHEQFLKYKQLWSNNEDVGMEFDPAAIAMLGAPFLARLFPWKKIKPQKPPPCYLKRRRRRRRIIQNGNHYGSNSDSKSCCSRKSSLVNNKNDNCIRCNVSHKLRPVNSFNMLQPNLNTLGQLSWNVNGKKNSSRLSNTDPLNSPVKSFTSFPKIKNCGVLADNLIQSSLNDLKQYDKNCNQQQHHHPHCAQMYPSLYNRYFDNDYELYKKLEDFTITLVDSTLQELPEDDIVSLERFEDEYFLKLIKELRLVDSDFDNEEDDEDFDEDFDDDTYSNEKEKLYTTSIKPVENILVNSNNGHNNIEDEIGDNYVNPPDFIDSKRNYIGKKNNRSKSANNSRSNSSSRSSSRVRFSASNECCCSCDCFKNNDRNNNNNNESNLNQYGQQKELDDPNDCNKSQKKKQKNEWSLTEQIVPFQVLKRPLQKWVWDIAFSADSQYVFTASSDNFVRLWSVYTGQMTREYSGHQKAVTALAFSDIFTD